MLNREKMRSIITWESNGQKYKVLNHIIHSTLII